MQSTKSYHGIILPTGVDFKEPRHMQFKIRQRIERDWVSTVSDSVVLCGAVANTASAAITSFDGTAAAGFLVLAIIFIIRICR